jgi:peptidoglycan-associated lipoprotein
MTTTRTTMALLATAAALGVASCTGMGSRGLVRAPTTCSDFTVSIYFETDSAAITPQAAAIIRAAARQAERCSVRQIDILGLASAPGDAAANQALSERRVASVTQALAARGLSHPAVAAGAAGEIGAETRTGLLRPLRRRVDIALHMGPRA